jgi:hypothetical protein
MELFHITVTSLFCFLSLLKGFSCFAVFALGYEMPQPTFLSMFGDYTLCLIISFWGVFLHFG